MPAIAPDRMICPACKGTLKRFVWKAVELDICLDGCRGIWFDYDELRLVQTRGGLDEIEAVFSGQTAQAPSTKAEDAPQPDDERERLCPRDQTAMHRYEWNAGSGIMMDSCPDCNGIWLDSGELEAYVAFVQRSQSSPTPLDPEVVARMQAIHEQVTSDLESMEDVMARRLVRWDLSYMDDVIRGLIRWVVK